MLEVDIIYLIKKNIINNLFVGVTNMSLKLLTLNLLSNIFNSIK